MQTRFCRLHAQGDIRIEQDDVAPIAADEVLVRVGAGGICGSDLHYFHEGGIGTIRVREPIILGHEAAGTIEAAGDKSLGLKAGDRVALNPSKPCNSCKYCKEGLFHHCLSMQFFGSAMFLPHTHGAFREFMVVKANQCVLLESDISLGEAACAEPLAVCLHARNQGGDLVGKTVLITGSGPIGALMTAVAKHSGAARILVTDLHDLPLDVAKKLGATEVINVTRDGAILDELKADKGSVDVTFECTGVGPAIETAILSTRPRGRIVQVGMAGPTEVPINLIVGKELQVVGSQRFHAEYAEAVKLIDSGSINVKPIISETYALDDAVEAFHHASDRQRAVKVQLNLAP